MSRIPLIQRIVRDGEELLAAIEAGDDDRVDALMASYDAAFDELMTGSEAAPLEDPERAALGELVEVHGALEAAARSRQAECREALGSVSSATRLTAYAPIATSSRVPRYLDRSA